MERKFPFLFFCGVKWVVLANAPAYMLWILMLHTRFILHWVFTVLFLSTLSLRCIDPASCCVFLCQWPFLSHCVFPFDFAHTLVPTIRIFGCILIDSSSSADKDSVAGFPFFIPSYVYYTIGFSFSPISIYVEGFPDLHGFPSSIESMLSCTLTWIQYLRGLNPSTQG